ncbi:TenA family transcriptional regulator [Lentzea sp. NPDC059081]|uniref:TenA family transcriptional regulator n=1 Tax=Lentzea sp. NPDC059081 TaxID=3346719 RepID=UPI0036BA9150
MSIPNPAIPPAPVITGMADRAIAEVNLLEDRYFTALADGTMSKEAFIATQEQFYRGVDTSPREMAVLISRIPRHGDRLAILRNIVEEHGDFHQAEFHVQSMRDFLTSLGSRTDPETIVEWPETDAFTMLMQGVCATAPLTLALACYGVMESVFADISTRIARCVADRGWLPEDRIAHYSLHAEIDKEHAAGFYAVAEPGVHDPAERLLVERGIALGLHAFRVYYRDLADHVLTAGADEVREVALVAATP